MNKVKIEQGAKKLRINLVKIRPFYPSFKISEPKMIGTTGFVSFLIRFGEHKFEVISNLGVKSFKLELYIRYEALGKFGCITGVLKKVISQRIILDNQKLNTNI